MIDQSHNLKGKIEATVQTVVTAQELWLKAALVDREELARLQQSCDLVAAEEAFPRRILARCAPHCRGVAQSARPARATPLAALRESGYVDRISRERGGRTSAVSSYA